MLNIALYIHIPFCKSKCDYCDFYSFKPREADKEKFEEALFREIDLKANLLKDKTVSSIYIGGGTPSVMSPEFFIKLKSKLDEICSYENSLEFTIEVNPSSFTEILAKTFKQVGVNRLSIGFQSANDRLLKYVHREDNFNQFENAMNIAKNYFSNISVDLMTAMPYQKSKDVKNSIKQILKFKPTHVSVYSLTVFENTPLFNLKNTLSFIPNEKTQVKMLNMADKMLERAGFDRYEVSNYAKKSKEDENGHISKYNRFISKHNSVYWLGGDYLGFGPSAASFINGVRLTNEKNFANYIEKNFNAEREVLTPEQIRLESIMLGLRTKWGCDKSICKQENVDYLLRNAYIKQIGDRIIATKKGLNVLNILIDKLT